MFSYDNEFQYPKLNPIFVRTEENQHFSLYANLHLGRGSIGWVDEGHPYVTSHTVRSGLVIIGQDFWPVERLVKRFRSNLRYVDAIFTATRRHRKIQHQKPQEPITDRLFSVRCGNITTRYRFALTHPTYSEYLQTEDPYIEIEVAGGVELEEYFLISKYVAGFFSVLFGIRLEPYDYKISNYLLAGYHRLINSDTNRHLNDHEVIYPRLKTQEDVSYYFRQIFFVGDHIIPNVRECLKFWISRREGWGKAIELMMQNFQYRTEHSGERLLSACRWFEEIPTVDSQRAISDEHSKVISKSAEIKASELGYDCSLSKRVYHAVSNIRDETRRAMFARLNNDLIRSFGPNILDKQFLTDLEYAYKYRGIAAHSLFKFESVQEHQNAVRGTLALELLNLMLTVVEMPIDNWFFEHFDLDERVGEYKKLSVEID